MPPPDEHDRPDEPDRTRGRHVANGDEEAREHDIEQIRQGYFATGSEANAARAGIDWASVVAVVLALIVLALVALLFLSDA